MTGVWLCARVPRPGGAEVWVPLGKPAETVFVEKGEAAPSASLVVRLAPDARGRPRTDAPDPNELALGELLLGMWPGAERTLFAQLEQALGLENRLDLENALLAFADLLDALCVWVGSTSLRGGGLASALRRHAPLLVRWLDQPVEAVALERCRRRGGSRLRGEPRRTPSPWRSGR